MHLYFRGGGGGGRLINICNFVEIKNLQIIHVTKIVDVYIIITKVALLSVSGIKVSDCLLGK